MAVKSSDEIVGALNDLQRFMDDRLPDWSPVERAFLLHQLSFTLHNLFHTIATTDALKKRRH